MNSVPLSRALFWTGLAAWLCVSLATVLQAQQDVRFVLWSCASAAFLLAYLYSVRRTRGELFALAAAAASVVAMVALLCNGYEGLLLVLLAAQVARRTTARMALTWIGIQTALCGAAIAFHWSPRAALLLVPPYLGFQLLMLAVMRAHADLLRAQAALADRSRLEERLRMAHDLHDSLGHHLVALNLHLELAAHEEREQAGATIRKAQTLARTILRDVKEIVHSARDELPVDLPAEMERLAAGLPRPRVHVACPADLCLADGRASRAMLRPVQEIVTNSIRHGAAENLWIKIERMPGEVRLSARDDGRARAEFQEGFGLSGMRRRLEALGGTLSATAARGGFEIYAALPSQPLTRE